MHPTEIIAQRIRLGTVGTDDVQQVRQRRPLLAMGQNWPFEERCPNGCFLIRKRPLGMVSVNDRFWPKAALRRHRESDRLCDSHEGLESTQAVL